jgi:hypothetical protein
MPETPLPHSLAEEIQSQGGVAEIRARTKRSSSPGRPVSAFAPAKPRSEPPLGPPLSLTPDDCSFVAALRAAGVASELEGPELARAAKQVRSPNRRARHIDLLASYYAAAGDPLASRRRQATDRWFCYSASDGLTAAQLLQRILSVLPEISSSVRLERVGGPAGTLVLHSGEHVCAIEDEREDEPGVPTVSVSGLVRGLNILLDRHGVRSRLLGLFGDGQREAYVSVSSMAAALPLAQADYLMATDAESLMELTGW